MKRYRFLFGFPLMIAFIIVGYALISFEHPTICIYTTEWIDESGEWVNYKSLDDYETLFKNGIIQRDANGKMLYYIVPIDDNGVQLDTIEFNSTQIKGTKDCN